MVHSPIVNIRAHAGYCTQPTPYSPCAGCPRTQRGPPASTSPHKVCPCLPHAVSPTQHRTRHNRSPVHRDGHTCHTLTMTMKCEREEWAFSNVGAVVRFFIAITWLASNCSYDDIISCKLQKSCSRWQETWPTLRRLPRKGPERGCGLCHPGGLVGRGPAPAAGQRFPRCRFPESTSAQ